MSLQYQTLGCPAFLYESKHWAFPKLGIFAVSLSSLVWWEIFYKWCQAITRYLLIEDTKWEIISEQGGNIKILQFFPCKITTAWPLSVWAAETPSWTSSYSGSLLTSPGTQPVSRWGGGGGEGEDQLINYCCAVQWVSAVPGRDQDLFRKRRKDLLQARLHEIIRLQMWEMSSEF